MDTALNNNRCEYTGDIKLQPKPGEQDEDGHTLYPYIPDKPLIEAVNLAIYLKRPLLLKGEPGCGKTRLARAVAYELKLPYKAWHIKSTSRALDGLYTYDTVGRLRDAQLAAQLAAMGRLKDKDISRVEDPTSYVRWGKLGEAFRNEQRTVVLIDEIDKADIDFPNDLLLELDELYFVVEETGQEVRAKQPPIVFITSNDEKDLPDAFLRRCLFHRVTFPDPLRLAEIINVHFPDSSPELVDTAMERFLALRLELKAAQGEAGKNVSTSELIDWFTVLRRYPHDEALVKLRGELPFVSVLLKSWDSHSRYITGKKI